MQRPRRFGRVASSVLFLIAVSATAQLTTPVLSALTSTQAAARINSLQIQKQSLIDIPPQVPAKDLFESTAEYQQRVARSLQERDKAIQPLDRTINELKGAFYAEPSITTRFKTYDADGETVTAEMAGETVLIDVPRAVAKQMYDAWAKVKSAFDHPEQTNIRDRTPALIWNGMVFPGFRPGTVHKIGEDVQVPVAILKPEPEYSEQARRAKIQGEVVLSVIVNELGIPKVVGVNRSLEPSLDRKAIEALSGWRFKPATRKGEPVSVQVTIAISFHLI